MPQPPHHRRCRRRSRPTPSALQPPPSSAPSIDHHNTSRRTQRTRRKADTMAESQSKQPKPRGTRKPCSQQPYNNNQQPTPRTSTSANPASAFSADTIQRQFTCSAQSIYGMCSQPVAPYFGPYKHPFAQYHNCCWHMGEQGAANWCCADTCWSGTPGRAHDVWGNDLTGVQEGGEGEEKELEMEMEAEVEAEKEKEGISRDDWDCDFCGPEGFCRYLAFAKEE